MPKEQRLYLVHGSIHPGKSERVLKSTQGFPKGSLVLVEMPEGRKEVFNLNEYPFPFPIEVKDVPVILRRATPKEIANHEKRFDFEKEGKQLCLQFAQELGLEMDLVEVECFFDRSKIIFYYTAPSRIDFRELVKQLAKALRTRIEMRQIGVRNETSLIGGIGPCGKEFCCSRFLKNFQPLSIKMAKEQGLILDPNKISGLCGRLLCCLNYEESWYKECLQNLPPLGSKLTSSESTYRILKYNFFQRIATVERDDGSIFNIYLEELKNFTIREEVLEEEEGQEV